MPPRIPRYARFSPDKDTSDEELENFTLISAESILPAGAKRARVARVQPQQLIFEEEVVPTIAPPSPARRRTRNVASEEQVRDVPEVKRRGRPPKKSTSPEFLRTPRKFKRRKVLPESDGEGSDSSEDVEDDEEPVRPMPSRRSARRASLIAPPRKVRSKPDLTPEPESEAEQEVEMDVRTRESSSDLSEPPDSPMDLDSSEEEAPDEAEKADVDMEDVAEAIVEEEVKPQALAPKKRGRPPAVKIPKESKPLRNKPSPKSSSSVVSTIEVTPSTESPDATMFSHLGIMSPEKKTHDEPVPVVLPNKETMAQLIESEIAVVAESTALVAEPESVKVAETVVGEMKTSEEETVPASTPATEESKMIPEAVTSAVPPIPKKANSAAKRAPATKTPTVEKARAAPKLLPASVVPIIEKAKAAAKSAPPSPIPMLQQDKPPSKASDLRITSSPRAFERQNKRAPEDAANRPASAGLSNSGSFASPPPRSHVRHRSMDIASLLNNEEPAPPKTYSPVYPSSLPMSHINPIEPNRSFGNTTPESFLRGSSGPPARNLAASSSRSESYSPYQSAGSQLSNSPFIPHSQNASGR